MSIALNRWRRGSRPAIWLATLGATAVLAACGTQVAPSAANGGSRPRLAGGAAGASGLCASTATVDRLVLVHRGDLGTAAYHSQLTVTFRNAAAVQGVARELCALPAMPTSRLGCPADFGNALLMTFWLPGRELPMLTVDLSGCRSVTGLTPSRWWSNRLSFLSSVNHTLGIRIPA